MTYYTEADVPVYYRLADEFLVCDRWFCSLPGPTWPNRWVTFCGTSPEIDNPENDDPRLGYMTEPTIFETLTQHGIEWKYFESDLSLIRLFDRYRLDDTNVLPLADLDGLLARSGPLPRVIVIEPNFVDVPGGTPNDDHPPADLADGQAFIAKVLDLFLERGRFDEVTFLITYDEHGGFYDHVAPPGSAYGDPAWLGQVPRIHPDGPECMGVRVPTFIVSPLVAASSISHEVFDHTSFIKTVLVHNRAQLPQSAFGRFGERVAKAAHLGQALNLDTPRPVPDLTFFGAPKPPPPRATWIDPAFDSSVVYDDKTGLYRDDKSGWVVVPKTGDVLHADTLDPIPVEVAVAYAPDRIVGPVDPKSKQPAVVWKDLTFKGLVLGDESGALVDGKSGYLVDWTTGRVLDPATGELADASAFDVLGEDVRTETPPANTARLRPVSPASDDPRDFHVALRLLCKPRRRYAP